jgi:predicted ATPase/class 3 adenylate cyclase
MGRRLGLRRSPTRLTTHPFYRLDRFCDSFYAGLNTDAGRRAMAVESPRVPDSKVPLPQGIVTFLYTDIEGSTRLWQEQLHAMPGALARHDALIREAVEGEGGVIFRRMGDAVCAAFSVPAAALTAASAAQQALAAEPWEEGCALRVRMAVHTGQAEVQEGDYVGHTLNRVARLLSAGHGGQILLSAETVDLAGGALLAGSELLDLGEHRLKDLARPEQIYQLTIPGLPQIFPALVTAGGQATNLPVESTPFIGREHELEAITQLLADPGVRLLTLIGPGGTGKTRLALAAAAARLPFQRDGVFAGFLAPLADAALVPSAIAEALGVKEEGGRDLTDVLSEYLSEKRILLVLDNYEHVLGGSGVVGALLAQCPRLQVLVTSRIPLHLTGEREYGVPPLSLPDLASLPDVGTLTRYDALVFFVDRARAVKADFALTDENAASVVAICRKLDGLPLAIELAAARVKLFPPKSLLPRLEHRLQLLTGGAKDRPTRQQTLRGAIDWSYSLLTDEEKALFARLSVFAGGCNLEATEAVCNSEGELDVLEGLTSLVDKSFVRQEGEEESRFSMLETMREYAEESLEERGEGDTIRAAHASFLLRMVQEAAPELTGPRQGSGSLGWRASWTTSGQRCSGTWTRSRRMRSCA